MVASLLCFAMLCFLSTVSNHNNCKQHATVEESDDDDQLAASFASSFSALEDLGVDWRKAENGG